MKNKTKQSIVDNIIQNALNKASDEDIVKIMQNLGRLLRSPKYQDFDERSDK